MPAVSAEEDLTQLTDLVQIYIPSCQGWKLSHHRRERQAEMDPNRLVNMEPSEDAPMSGRVVMASVFGAKLQLLHGEKGFILVNVATCSMPANGSRLALHPSEHQSQAQA